ncbi:MFS transporter [Candidatus Thorarchaeota archaeon]|nr:MAG: MFS transporter [Candidatus Thorarchaeota archaeon]
MDDTYDPPSIDFIDRVHRTHLGFLGLSKNLWRLAAVLAIAQFSTALWKWEFSIFLEGFLEPWQMGVVFSGATFAGLVASVFSGYIADFIGRRWTISLGFIPVIIGLITLSYFPIWPFVAVQYGLVWFGMSTSRLISRAIPADEIASDHGHNPARRLMMVMMPLWFVDALGPLVGSFLMNYGYQSGDLHRIGGIAAIITFLSAVVLIRESLGSEVIKKARAGPKISIRNLGREYWIFTTGMIGFSFSWSMSIPLLGNLCVGPWNVDIITYGLTWSLFSLTSAIIMYPASIFADRNLKGATIIGILGNALIFLWFSVGTGALQMYLINFLWAIPFVLWIGAERSIIVLVVSKETKGRALGTYDLLMGLVGVIAAAFGALLWEITSSLRYVYAFAGVGMFVSLIILIPLLQYIHPENYQTNNNL